MKQTKVPGEAITVAIAMVVAVVVTIIVEAVTGAPGAIAAIIFILAIGGFAIWVMSAHIQMPNRHLR